MRKPFCISHSLLLDWHVWNIIIDKENEKSMLFFIYLCVWIIIKKYLFIYFHKTQNSFFVIHVYFYSQLSYPKVKHPISILSYLRKLTLIFVSVSSYLIFKFCFNLYIL